MATQWEKVKYISRLRPDCDDTGTNECNDLALHDHDIQIKVNDEYLAHTAGKRRSFNDFGHRQSLHPPQSILKAKSHDCIRLSIQDAEKQTRVSHEDPIRRTSSVFSLLNGDELDGDITKRSQPFLKSNPRVLVKDLFAKHRHEGETSFDFKVSWCDCLRILR